MKLARAARPRPGSAPSGPLVLAEAGALTRPPAVGSSRQQPLAPAQRAPGGRATVTVAWQSSALAWPSEQAQAGRCSVAGALPHVAGSRNRPKRALSRTLAWQNPPALEPQSY